MVIRSFLSENKLFIQLGLRAALCVLIVWAVDAYWHLPRPYWGVLTVLLLVKQSWGEMISMASKRLAMTVLGCGLGTMIYLYWAHNNHAVMLIVMLMAIFFTIFLIPKYYASAMFFIGIMVVMLFGTIALWNTHILWMRIEQTALACTVLVIVMRLFMPRFARSELRDHFQSVIKKINSLWGQLLIEQQGGNKDHLNHKVLDKLGQTFNDLQQSYANMRYELLLHPKIKRYSARMMRYLELSIHYSINLIQLDFG